MVCIFCNSSLDVTNSRPKRSQNQVWRRRHCQKCDAYFTTYEKIDHSGSWRVKYPQKLVPFSAKLLFTSIYEACKHRPNPVTDAEGLCETVVSTLALHRSPVIEQQQIITATREVLQNFDSAAAVQYTAFHPVHSTQK